MMLAYEQHLSTGGATGTVWLLLLGLSPASQRRAEDMLGVEALVVSLLLLHTRVQLPGLPRQLS